MTPGTLYGIGVGPGDPDLITVKGAKILARCRHVFVPKARSAGESVALAIARRHIPRGARIHEQLFPMSADESELSHWWNEAAREISAVLKTGADACFLTLGDALLYSTYIYLLRGLRKHLPRAKIVTIPGVTAFSAAAALTNFPVGEGKRNVTIVPAADDLRAVRKALACGGTVVLMKVGRRLERILQLLKERKLTRKAVFVAHAGQPNQRVETDLRKLKATKAETGYLSVILVNTSTEHGMKDPHNTAATKRRPPTTRHLP
jgi:precorrin-2/cobalt-factor-2 C20-methyltransferase